MLTSPSPRSLLCNSVDELRAWLHCHGRGPAKLLKQAHARLLRHGLDEDSFLLNLLLKSLFESGCTAHASLVFSLAPSPNLHLCNTAVRGLVNGAQWLQAVRLYREMRTLGMSPNNFTFPFVLKACARLSDLELGKNIHANLFKSGLDRDVHVSTSLVGVYAKCGRLTTARALFEEMPAPNVVSWTAIISGYMEEGRLEEALALFERMLRLGLEPDSFTLVRVINACAQLGNSLAGSEIHRLVEEKGALCNVFVATALVDLHAKCGDMERAREVFDRMPHRDVVTWSTMVGGYAANGLPREALAVFELMEKEKVEPDEFTVLGLLSACAKIGALELGRSYSARLDRRAFLCNPILGTALIDLHAKCGSAGGAWAVFAAMEIKDVVCVNATISGLAMNGHTKLCFALFAAMERSGLRPNHNTFVGLLCACTHSGLVQEGRRLFEGMTRVYGVAPKVEHFGCMVDLLGRTGLLEEALGLVRSMPVAPNAVVWGALLSGCRLHRNAAMAEQAAERLVELEPGNSGNYVQLSNLYASRGRWAESAALRRRMQRKGIEKLPGCSWIEFGGAVHEFKAGELSQHPLREEIGGKLEELGREMRRRGYVASTEVVLFDVEEEEKEATLGHHSEKLAVAFGLVVVPVGEVVRVVKNLRVCADCHEAIKLVSEISGREIVVRDTNRFHCFNRGSCSCGDFW
ncbi:pentatricopeptide repeat (PPR) superfamily protein [Wolffia australiana]